jgi:6-phosphofructokinase 1
VEDIDERLSAEETLTDPKTGQKSTRKIMDVPKLVDVIVRAMLAREKLGKEFGVVVLAEGLGSFLPADYLEGIKFDEHGHISLGQTNLARIMAKAIEKEYEKRTGKKRRLTGLQLGYEARCSLPLAFDVILGSQLGVGAYRALVEHQMDGVMVSCAGQLTLNYVPFETLVDPETLVTVVRHIPPGSDFHRLARFLEVYPQE